MWGYCPNPKRLDKHHSSDQPEPQTTGHKPEGPARSLSNGARLISYVWRLTAISLITHVSTVVVEITPPNAVDTVAVAAAILVAKTGVL